MENISFQSVVSIVSACLVLGAAFNAWYSLRERVVKLEMNKSSQEDKNSDIKILVETVGKMQVEFAELKKSVEHLDKRIP